MNTVKRLEEELKGKDRPEAIAKLLEEGHDFKDISREISRIDRKNNSPKFIRPFYDRVFLLKIAILFVVIIISWQAIHYLSAEKIYVDGKAYPLNREISLEIPEEDVELRINVSTKMNNLYIAKKNQREKDEDKHIKNGTFSYTWYWNNLVESDEENQFLDMFISKIGSMIDDGSLRFKGEDAKAYYAVNIVQDMTYDYSKYFFRARKTRFPYETLYDQKGVCRETSVLLAKILARMGYDTAIIAIPRINHAIIGIRCDSPKAIKGYCLIETTADTPIGGVSYQTSSLFSKELSGSDYQILKISDGKKFEANYHS